MARQGRFGRPTSGTQNLSSLIYMLLKEERNAQEDTMLRSYSNNMQGGTTRNTFTSSGQTSSATATSVYQWYLKQAQLAASQGDNVGYNSLLAKAEDFRLQSLRDQETVLSNAYNNGTSIDKGLFGLTGSNTLTLNEYEALLGQIGAQPGMTEADISRINRSIFGASYDSAAAQMVRDYNEKKIGAKALVDFYDKEIKRADATGVPRESARYQAILDARSKAVAAGKADAAQARRDYVTNRIKDEKKSLAIALQKFLSPVFDVKIISKSNKDALKAKITDDGSSFMTTLGTISRQYPDGTFAQWIAEAGSRAGMGKEELDSLMGKMSDFSKEVIALRKSGYVDETADLNGIALSYNANITQGAFGAIGTSASARLSGKLAESGGDAMIPRSSDPYATRVAFDDYIKEMSTVSTSDKYDEIGLADDIVSIGQGDLSSLMPGAPKADIDSLVTDISKQTGLDEQDVLIAFSDLMTNPNAWNQQTPNLVKVGSAMKRYGYDPYLANQAASVGGEITLGTVARLAIEKNITDRVDKDKNLVWAYQRKLGGYVYAPVAVAKVSTEDYSITSASGNKTELIYVERVQMKTTDGNGNLLDSGIFYVANPGGGDMSNQEMDFNDYIEFEVGSAKYRLQLDDLNDFSTFAKESGIDWTTPMVDTQTGQIRIGKAFFDTLKNESGSSVFKNWLDVTSMERGQDWYDSKVISTQHNVSVQGKASEIFGGYIADINKRLIAEFGGANGKPNLDPMKKGSFIGDAIDKYLTENGIVDKTGKIKKALEQGLLISTPVDMRNVNATGGGDLTGYPSGYTSGYPSGGGSQPFGEPGLNPYTLSQTGGSYSVPVPNASPSYSSTISGGGVGQATQFFFRRSPGIVNPEVAPAPSVNTPVVTPLPTTPVPSTPIAGGGGGGGISVGPKAL